jgi:single-strand DNA-binding protein
MMFNKVVLLGNLTRDIEIRYSQNNSAIANTGIATSRKFTTNGEKKEEVCFVDLTFFGRTGEIAHQYLRKGSKVMIEGRLSLDQWTDDKGQKHSKHSIIVETMQMMGSKTNGEEISETTYDAPPPNNRQNRPDQIKTVLKTTENDSNPFDDGIKEEDIPF